MGVDGSNGDIRRSVPFKFRGLVFTSVTESNLRIHYILSLALLSLPWLGDQGLYGYNKLCVCLSFWAMLDASPKFFSFPRKLKIYLEMNPLKSSGNYANMYHLQ